jgi:hypothetical protein
MHPRPLLVFRVSNFGFRALSKGLEWIDHRMDMLVTFKPQLVTEAEVGGGGGGQEGIARHALCVKLSRLRQMPLPW